MHAHGQAARVKTDGHADAGQAGKSGIDHHLHPAMVSVHCHAVDVTGPALPELKRPDLRHRQRQYIVLLEQRQQVLIKDCAVHAGAEELVTAKRPRLLMLPQGLGLDLRAILGV